MVNQNFKDRRKLKTKNRLRRASKLIKPVRQESFETVSSKQDSSISPEKIENMSPEIHPSWVAERELLTTKSIKPKKGKKKVRKSSSRRQSVRIEVLEGLAEYL